MMDSLIPKVSIITVVYNGEDSIESTILSVLKQNYSNIEYIIIDGGSSDKTLEIINKYRDRITSLVSEPDKGIYDAMNKGIDISSGQWINFMNSGDTFCSETVVSQVFCNHLEEFNVVYGNVVNIWNNCVEIRHPNFKDKTMPFCHQSVFTRDFLLKKYKFDISYKICADRNFYKTLHKNLDYHEKYLNIDISNFECVTSLSANNELKRFDEIAKIEEYSLLKKILKKSILRFKKYIKQTFPQFTNFYRKSRANFAK